ncbi:MAG TPA: hypothetical protein VG603_11285, partial [Chitinophagales bacterium]|nr:hypothetical protein [Chitinophagales bacterium]
SAKTIVPPDKTGGKPDTNTEQPTNGGIQKGQPAKQQGLSPEEFELKKDQLLLIDATLDLNETLLQGVKASLDSLNVHYKNVVDERDMQATLHRMERERDRALLRPYLLHMQDSLKTEIDTLQKQKAQIEASLNGTQMQAVKSDTTVASVEASVPPLKEITIGPPVKMPVTTDTVTAPKPVIVQKCPSPADTTFHIQKDTAEKLPLAATRHDTTVVIRLPGVLDLTGNKIVHWERAKALNPIPQLFEELSPEDSLKQVIANRDSAAYVAQKKNVPAPQVSNPQVADSALGLKAKMYLTRAQKAIADANYPLAEQYLKRAIDARQKDFESWITLAELHAKQGMTAKAMSEYQICRDIDSSSPRLYSDMGDLAYKMKMRTEADDYYEKALELDSNYVSAIMGQALLLTERRQYARAIMEYNHVLRLDITYHSAYKYMGIARFLYHNYLQAVDDFNAYLLFHDKDALSYYYRGLSKIELKMDEEGCYDLEQAQKYGYKNADAAIERNCGVDK